MIHHGGLKIFATSQEKEIHRHFQLHFAMRGMPNRSKRPEGHSLSFKFIVALLSSRRIGHLVNSLAFLTVLLVFVSQFQEAVEHAQATGHVNFQEYR